MKAGKRWDKDARAWRAAPRRRVGIVALAADWMYTCIVVCNRAHVFFGDDSSLFTY